MAVLTYKCPNCDGGLVFDPTKQAFCCEYCASAFTEAQLEEMTPAAQSASPAFEQKSAAKSDATIDTALYSCPSCGAEVACNFTDAAAICYYCQNPLVFSSRLAGEFCPQLVIPFSVDREQAIARFLESVGKRWFVPSGFFNKRQIDKITGVYFPYWVIGSTLNGQLHAEGIKLRVWRSGNTEYTETEYYDIRRSGRAQFEELTKNALQTEYRELVEGVLPFSLKDAREYSPGYLQGFQAQRRDIEPAQLASVVQQELAEYTDRLLHQTISGYSSVHPRLSSADVVSENWRYALFPVWVLTYRSSQGKLMHYALNGQTGKLFGALPLSLPKLAALFAASATVAFSVLALLMGGFL